MTRSDFTPSPDPPDSDELLRHAAWLHALARTLVGEANADDVVQETWVAAIARRPHVLGSLRAWLGAVARNVVRQSARADSRRREREAVAARHEGDSSTDDVVARAARMRELVGRVLALDEPYRTAILLRFFEGVKPQEIARRVGASDEAVRQRLRRGLDRLRAGLDADHDGDRASWIAAFAPLVATSSVPIATAATSLVAKGITMSAKTKCVAAGAVVIVAAGVAVVLQPWRERASVTQGGVSSAPERASAEDPLLASGASRVEDHREPEGGAAKPTASEPRAAADGGNPIRFVYGAVVDTSGAAVEGARLNLYAVDSPDPKAPTATSPWESVAANGVWSAGGLAPGRWHVDARHESLPACERDFTVDPAGEGNRVDLVFRKSLVIPVRIRAPDGRALAEAMKPEAERGVLFNVGVLGFAKAPPERFEIGFYAGGQLDGAGRWFVRNGTLLGFGDSDKIPMPADADGVLVIDGDAPPFVALIWKHLTLASARLGDPARGVDLVVDPRVIRDAISSVRVRLVDAVTKRPIDGISVMREDDRSVGPAKTEIDRNGELKLNDLMPGLHRLTFQAPGYERLGRSVAIDAGVALDLGTIELSHPLELHGRVKRTDGKPPPQFISVIEIEAGSPPANFLRHYEHHEIHRDGEFVLAGLGRGRYLVRATDADCAIATTVVDMHDEPLPSPVLELVAGVPVTFDLTKPWPLQFPTFELDTAERELVEPGCGFGPMRLRPGRYRFLARRGTTAVVDLPFEVGDSPLTITLPCIADPNGLTRGEAANRAQDSNPSPIAPKVVGDPIGIVCYGRVVGGDARGIREGGATCFNSRNSRSWGLMHDGCFAVAGLVSGRSELQMMNGVRLTFTDWIELSAAPALQRRDFEIPPGLQVAITLVDAKTGAPLERIPENARHDMLIPRFTVIATKEPPPSEVPVLDPDWNYFSAFGAGRFQWSNPSDFRKGGGLDIGGELPVFVSLVSGGHVLNTRLLDAPVASLELPVDWSALRGIQAELRFRLVDATTGEPLAASRIDVCDTSVYPGGPGAVAPLPFDSDGGYVRTGLPPGECKLCVVVLGHESLEHEIVLPSGQVTDLGTIALGEPRYAKGHVVDAHGRPLKVSTIKTLDVERARRPVPLRSLAYGASAEDGSFSVSASHGVIAILFADERFAATCLEVDPAKEPIDDLRVVLEPGIPVTIHLLPEDVSREEISVEDRDGHLVALRKLTMGSCRLNLRPGKYSAAASVNGEEVARDDFEVKDQPVEVALER